MIRQLFQQVDFWSIHSVFSTALTCTRDKATRFLHRFLPRETDMDRRYGPKDNLDKNYGRMHPLFELEVSIGLSMLNNYNILRLDRLFSSRLFQLMTVYFSPVFIFYFSGLLFYLIPYMILQYNFDINMFKIHNILCKS